MIVATTDSVPGYDIEKVIGFVEGSSVRTVHIGKHFRGWFRRWVGGELTYYSELMEKTRTEARERMVKEAEKLGADAVVGVKYITTMIATGASEVIAYGTAIKLK